MCIRDSYNSRSLSVYTQSESDNQYSRTYRLPNTDGIPKWVWVGSFRAATATGTYDMRLDFTSHSGSANPNSEQDTIMILRFKISNGVGVFGNGDAYYIGGVIPNPSYFRN